MEPFEDDFLTDFQPDKICVTKDEYDKMHDDSTRAEMVREYILHVVQHTRYMRDEYSLILWLLGVKDIPEYTEQEVVRSDTV